MYVCVGSRNYVISPLMRSHTHTHTLLMLAHITECRRSFFIIRARWIAVLQGLSRPSLRWIQCLLSPPPDLRLIVLIHGASLAGQLSFSIPADDPCCKTSSNAGRTNVRLLDFGFHSTTDQKTSSTSVDPYLLTSCSLHLAPLSGMCEAVRLPSSRVPFSRFKGFDFLKTLLVSSVGRTKVSLGPFQLLGALLGD